MPDPTGPGDVCLISRRSGSHRGWFSKCRVATKSNARSAGCCTTRSTLTTVTAYQPSTGGKWTLPGQTSPRNPRGRRLRKAKRSHSAEPLAAASSVLGGHEMKTCLGHRAAADARAAARVATAAKPWFYGSVEQSPMSVRGPGAGAAAGTYARERPAGFTLRSRPSLGGGRRSPVPNAAGLGCRPPASRSPLEVDYEHRCALSGRRADAPAV